MTTIREAGEVAGAVGALAGTGYGVWEWVIKPIRNRMRRERAFRTEVEMLIRELPKLKEAVDGLAGAIKEAASDIRHHTSMSSARSRAIAVAQDVAMWESDESGLAVWLSPCLLKLLDLDHEDAKGFGWKAGIHPDDIELVDDAWSRSVKDKRIFDLEYRTRNGTMVRGYAYTIRDAEGAVRGFVGTLTEL